MRTDGTRPLGKTGHLATPVAQNAVTASATAAATAAATPEAAGRRALAALFRAHLGPPTPATRALMELFGTGGLGAATLRALEAEGLGPRDLLAQAFALQPHTGELGVAGRAMAATATAVLADAETLNDLAMGGPLRRTIAESLPSFLAEAIAAGHSPLVQRGAEEMLQQGMVSPDTYAQLGTAGLAELLGLLSGNRDAIASLLDPAGAQLFDQALDAASAAAPAAPDFFAFVTGFLGAMPKDTGALFSHAWGGVAGLFKAQGRSWSGSGASGTTHAKGGVGLEGGGVTARGQAGAFGQAGAQAGAAGSFDGPGVHGEGHAQAQAHVQAQAGATGSVRGDESGVSLEGSAGASVKAEASVDGHVEADVLGGAASGSLDVHAHVRAEAAARVDVKGKVGFDEHGDLEAYGGVDAKLIAKAEAMAQGKGTLNLFGFKFTFGGYASAAASVGAEASANAGYTKGKFFLNGSAGVGAKAGAGYGGFMSMEVPGWARSLINGVGKLPGGPQAIGLLGQGMGAVVGLFSRGGDRAEVSEAALVEGQAAVRGGTTA